jgi:Putative DNA-binding domain
LRNGLAADTGLILYGLKEGGTLPKFVPLTATGSLPPTGSAAEDALWDLKRTPSQDKFELAKDVAAFANHFGGTILIGAQEQRGHVQSYYPLSLAEIDATEKDITAAVRARCSPVPTFNFARFNHDAGWVLAVNVWPIISTICGVRIKGDTTDGWGDHAWIFPVRIGNHTTTVRPESFPMYMLPELRRTLLLLHAIPEGAQIVLKDAGSTVFTNGKIIEINEDTNTIVLSHDPLRAYHAKSYPLDAIKSVHKTIPSPSSEAAAAAPPMWWINIQHSNWSILRLECSQSQSRVAASHQPRG